MPNFYLFLTAALLLTIAPGPDNMYVLTRGITQGKAAAISAALGFTTGLIGHTACAALGIAAVIRSSVILFSIIRYAGAAYLLYLGYAALRSKEPLAIGTSTDNPAVRRIYCQSVIANLLNPKVSLFFLSFLPQFVDPSAGNVPVQMMVLGLVFMAQTAVIFCAIAVCSGAIGTWLHRRPLLGRHLSTVAGVTFIGLGLRLAVHDR